MSDDTPPESTERGGLRADLLAGGFVAGVGIVALVIALGYDLGTPGRMGPGFVPTILCVVLIVLGVGIAVAKPSDEQVVGRVRLRPIVFILGAILSFGLLIGRAGLIPAIIPSVAIAALAEPGRGVVQIVLLAAGVAVMVAGVFVFGLNVPIDLFWW